ncbi:MAG: S8 family serine peptidase [Aeromicrobium sp.]|nr:S8 family serine peptidase [Burkholderiales bacterium]
MYLKLRRNYVLPTALALALTAISVSAAAVQKFDAKISGAMTKAGVEKLGDGTYKLMRLPEKVEVVKILVRFSDKKALDGIRSAGGTVNSVFGNIATVAIPATALGTLVSMDEIQYIEAERAAPLRLNSSVPATRASLLRSGISPDLTGATGAGVIVGIVDDGIDFRHRSFRNPDGSTRLLALWDQRAAGAAGSPPTGFNYGGECTVQMLNDAINGTGGCTQPSTGNHGTHVAGIAAGNGQQTGNGQAAYRFVGMAPKADILSSNSIAGGLGGNTPVLDGIAWMKAKAAALGKPLVVNLSLGSYFGARDGTSNYEQALSNAGGPGVVITSAAGNEGGDNIVALGKISASQTVATTFRWATTIKADQQIEIWYPGVNQYAVKLTGPNGCEMPDFVVAGTSRTFNLPCGIIEVTSTAPQANNDDRQILVSFSRITSNVTGFQGNWTYELRGDVVATPDTDFFLICGEDSGGLIFTSNTYPGFTLGILTDTSTPTRTISVASYNTNFSWQTAGGAPNTPSNYNHGAISNVSTFSSRGPRRNCSNLAKCPPVMKPEIAAPGAMIMSALGQDAKTPSSPETVEADGHHVAYNGTSMATPHLTGAIALMLQKNPTLTPEQVKQILFQTVQTNGFTTGLPTFNPASPLMPASTNNNWGYGILDAQAAVNAVPASGGGTPTTNPYTGLWWNAPANSESGWGMSLTQRGSILFMAWYTYDSSGAPVWYVITNCPVVGTSCSGDIFSVSGGVPVTVPWNNPTLSVLPVGRGTFAFADASNGVFTYTLNGVAGVKNITRQVFVASGTPPAVDYTSLYWAAPANSESGWGVSLTQQFGIIFVALYTYDANRKPIWYVVTNCPVVGNGCTGQLFQVNGGRIPTDAWGSPALNVQPVGNMTLSFTDASNGTMSFTINGVAGSKVITKQIF